jgi:5-methylcytosine-specific restriction endonuclease McrA
MTYEEQLQDDRWKLRREEILRRDWWMCQVCMSTKNLQVHHKQYLEGLMAWEYEDRYLTTLCKNCHSLEHDKVYVSKPLSIRDAIKLWVNKMSGR